MQLAPPPARPRVEGSARVRVRPGSRSAPNTSRPLRACSAPDRTGTASCPGAVTENMTASFSGFRFSNSRRRVSRAQIGANSGHLRELQRRTLAGIRPAATGAAVPDPLVSRLELAVPALASTHASPAVSAARHAARPCGVNPLRGFPSLRSVTPQRRPAKARLRRQATLTGSVGRRAQASTSSSAGADAKDRTSPSAASPARSRSTRDTTSGSGRHPTAD